MGYIPRGDVAANAALYRDVHRLSGLAQALEDRDSEDKEPTTMKEFAKILDWSKDDISQVHRNYAADDIRMISELWKIFTAAHYINEQLRRESAAYVALWITDGQPGASDEFRLNALLPLGIIDGTGDAYGGGKKPCAGCKRSLPRNCFSRNAWENVGKCHVCRAVGLRINRQDTIARNRSCYDSDDDGYGYGYGGYESGSDF
ncbi:3'-5' exonuclease domain-containing protein [Mycena kentingensis (nom. inval.)]|nr:3'-5' exonuclease domain-containing protein [Mycena kentingensis (nom. inval.)]